MPGTPTPKDRFTALDTLAVAREVRARGRARVDKAFDLPEGGWSVTLRVPGEGRLELLLVPGRYAALLPFGVGTYFKVLMATGDQARCGMMAFGKTHWLVSVQPCE